MVLWVNTNPKGHVSFTAWKHEVEGLLSIYPQKAVVQAIRRSLKSPAAEVVWCLGQEASYEDIIEALETRYDDVAEGEVLLSELFSTTQGEKESLIEYASRLESILYRLSKLDGAKYGGGDAEILKVNFFRGLRDDKLREALRPRKEQITTFNQMLKEARRLESDQSKRNTVRVRTNALTIQEPQVSDRDWLEERFQKMETKLQNEVKAQIASVQQNATQIQQENGQGRGRGGFRGRGNRGRYGGIPNQRQDTQHGHQGAMNNNPPAQGNNGQADDWDPSQVICYACGGAGHYQNGCAFRGNGPYPNYQGSGRGGHR